MSKSTKQQPVQQGKYIETSVYVPMKDTMLQLADSGYLDDVAFQTSSVPFLGIYKDLTALDEHFYGGYFLSNSIMEKVADELTRQLKYNVTRMLEINDDIELDTYKTKTLENGVLQYTLSKTKKEALKIPNGFLNSKLLDFRKL